MSATGCGNSAAPSPLERIDAFPHPAVRLYCVPGFRPLVLDIENILAHVSMLRRDLPHLSQYLADCIDQNILAVGLRYVAVGTDVQAAPNILGASQRRKHDHRQQ